jgi:hypothetical protein
MKNKIQERHITKVIDIEAMQSKDDSSLTLFKKWDSLFYHCNWCIQDICLNNLYLTYNWMIFIIKLGFKSKIKYKKDILWKLLIQKQYGWKLIVRYSLVYCCDNCSYDICLNNLFLTYNWIFYIIRLVFKLKIKYKKDML